MGLAGSKTIIPIKEADAKLGASLRIEMDKAYHRITESGIGEARLLDVKAFQRNFLEAFPMMPKILVESLFDAFGAARRGAVSLEEFVCAVAVMHRGTAPEQLRMLFEVYDIRRATFIEIDHVRRLLDHIYGSAHSETVDQALAWLFRVSSREDEMDADEFIARLTPVVDFRGTAAAAQAEPLLQWFRVLCTRILEEPHPAVVALEQRYNPERDLSKVVTKYKLSAGLTDVLCRRHAFICRRSSANALDVQEWLSSVGYLFPETLARRVFQYFAQSGGLAWTVADLLRFLCSWVLDPRQEHVSMMFQLFDVDRDGLLSEREVAQMLEHLAVYHAHRASGGGGGGGGSHAHQAAHHHRGQHRHHHHSHHHHHHADMASLTLGLRKLGYEDLESLVLIDKQYGADAAAAAAAITAGGGSDGGGSGGVRDGTDGTTRAVARKLLRDMRATSERYVVVPTASSASSPATPTASPLSQQPPAPPIPRLPQQQQQQQQQRNRQGPVAGAGAGAGGGGGAAVNDAGGPASEKGGGLRGGSGVVGGGGLTLAGFMAWSSVHGGRLMLVKDLVYACLAEFGMRPAKAVQEREVIHEIFRRHDVALDDGEGEGLPYGPVGTTWAVINAQWWAQWRDYVRIGFDATMPRGSLSRVSSNSSIASNGGGGSSGGRQGPPATVAGGGVRSGTVPNGRASGGGVGGDSSGLNRSSPPPPSSIGPTMTPRSRASSRVFGSAPVLGGRGHRVGSGGGGGGGGGGQGAVGGAVGANGGGGGAYLASSSSFATQQTPRPGQIHNGALLEHGGSRRIVRAARLGPDFAIIPPKAWDALQSWYEGGPVLERRVIDYHGTPQLELFPLSLKVASCDVKGKPRQFEREMLFSKVDKVSDVVKQLSEANKVEPERSRLWNYADRVDWKKQHVLTPGHTLEEAKLLDGQLVLLEISQQDGAWPRSQLQSTFEAEEEEAQAGTAVSGHNKAGVIGDGMVGLGNLGNTCYINSSVQCLSHTPLLTEYFLSSAYVNDVNVDNKLGLQGRLAHVYADLVNDLWSPTKKTVSPKSFKNEIAKFNDLFGGHDQHDAQELLAFLLNGLNEDLNRIADKPYIEQPDSDGRSDAELADIWWKNHLRREFSIVVALFAGQFKSVLACRECGYESARFEPFMFLQLPLPEDTERSVMVIVVLLDGARCPAKCSLRLPKSGRVSDLVRAIVDTFNAPPTERARRPPPPPPEPPKLKAVASSSQGGDGSEQAESQQGKRGGGGNEGDGKQQQEEQQQQEEEEEEEEEEEDNLEEERRFYTRVGLRCEDLAVVDINAHKIFATVSPDRTLQSMKEHEMFYVYQLERDVYGEAAAAKTAAAAAAAAAAAKPAPVPAAPPTGDVCDDAETDVDDDDEDDDDNDDGCDGEERPAAGAAAVAAKGAGAAAAAAADNGGGGSGGSTRADGSGRQVAEKGRRGEERGKRELPPPEVRHTQVAGRDGAAKGVPAAAAAAGAAGEGARGQSASGKGRGDTARVRGKPAAVAAAQPRVQPIKQIRTPVRLFAVLHRRLETSKNFLTSPYRLEVFGTPLVCRVVPMTGRQLYDKLYRRFHRFLRLKAGGVSAASSTSSQRRRRDDNNVYGGSTASGRGGSPSSSPSSTAAAAAGRGGRRTNGEGEDEEEEEEEDGGVQQPCMGTGDDRDCPQTVRATSAWVAAGEVNRWGFRLRLVESNGYACSRCRWTEGCVGCFIRPDDTPCPVRAGDSVGVDWHISVIKEHYDASEALSCLLHSSIALHKDLEARPLSLEKCLDTFTAQEDIKEGYCSRCKEFRNASKKMDVWRLPPILAIQLKRFQYTQYSRRKLRNNVHFPVNGLDLSPYVVKDPASGATGGSASAHFRRQQQQQQQQQQQSQQPRPPDGAGGNAGPPPGGADGAVGGRAGRGVAGDASPSVSAVAGARDDGATVCRDHAAAAAATAVASPSTLPNGGGDSLPNGMLLVPGREGGGSGGGREGEGPAALAVEGTGGEGEGGGGGVGVGMTNPGVIGADGGRGGSLYDLYSVVHHLGALSSGHYVASVKSQPTGKWHYFNDDQVTEVDEDELGSSSSSAYILFYMRRDCAGLRIEDVYPSGPPKTVEEVEALMLHRDAAKCRIM